MKTLSYKVERTKDCIKIKIDNWIKNNSNIVQEYTLSGKAPINYITEALDINLTSPFKSAVSKGDFVLLTSVISDIAQYKPYIIDQTKYYNVPVMQVVGVFRDRKIGIDSLVPIFDKIIFKKINRNVNSTLICRDQNTVVGKVIKVGSCRFDRNWNKSSLSVRVGDTILVRDNVTTTFILNGEEYCATEESMVVGIFHDNINTLEDINIINENILMQKYKPKNILNSNLLIMPDINFDELDEASLDNQDQFEILFLDEKLTKLRKHDIVFVNKDITNYVWFNNERYFIISGMEYIEGKLLV